VRVTPAAQLPQKVARRTSAFVDATVRVRFPEILRSVQAELHERGCHEQVWALWRAVVHEQALDLSMFANVGDFWPNYLLKEASGLEAEPTWQGLPFFDLEFLFYHAINSLTGYFVDGFDVFGRIKSSALQTAMATRAAEMQRVLLEPSSRTGLCSAVHWALLGNQADLSQLDYLQGRSASGLHGGSSGNQSGLLLDECEQLLDHVLDGSCDSVHLVLDNAGAELCFDLILVDTLLRHSPAQVVMHAKPCPMFVSDARPCDVEQTVRAFKREGADLAACAKRLDRALSEGRLLLRAESDWGQPRDFGQLSVALTSDLAASSVVIAKGDLNYRRFLSDRLWPVDTPPGVATAGVQFRAFCLRVLKSDVMIGLAVETAESAQRVDPGWRTSGRFAVIQRL